MGKPSGRTPIYHAHSLRALSRLRQSRDGAAAAAPKIKKANERSICLLQRSPHDG
jgi:hypothetical protein